jgi:hypothetical protein
MEFMGRTACRRATHLQRGSLFEALRILLSRMHPDDKGPYGTHFIRVLYQRADKGTGLSTRMMTGLNQLPMVPAMEVHEYFKHEVAARVPRSKMAKGAFAYGSLVKVVARQGLNVIDGDQQRCFIQNRLRQLPEHMRQQCPNYVAYMQDPDAVCHWGLHYMGVSQCTPRVGVGGCCGFTITPALA